MNYKHLFYFWKVASTGGVIRAAEELHTTPQTLSGQIKLLEERMGAPLFRKQGRKLELTDAGQLALGYAEEIFSLGAELEDLLANDAAEGAPVPFRVGVADALPNALSEMLLAPVLQLDMPVRLIARAWRVDRLLAELALHRLDLVLADSPVPAGFSVKAYSHELGRSPMSFFATPALAARLPQAAFPKNLQQQPMLLLSEDSDVRAQFERWARSQQIRVRVAGEFDDTGLIKAFGRSGAGVFLAPRVLAADICRNYDVIELGSSDAIQQAYYAITVQRRISHPCAEAIVAAARAGLLPAP